MHSLINHTSNMKLSLPTPASSNSGTISGFAISGVAPARSFVGNFTVPVAIIGRKDAAVAGRAIMCGVEADTLRNVEGRRPVAVTGRVG
jgi:hypothetical protein